MSIVVLRPQLGVPFKKFSAARTNDENDLPPIRQHWANFYRRLINFLDSWGLEYDIVCKPLWRFTEAYINALDADLVFIPHKNVKQYCNLNKPSLFIMQSVFPHLFTIDRSGWGATSSEYPFSHTFGNMERAEKTWQEYRQRITRNISKFEQPNEVALDLPERYALYLCQLPHDETIRFHSDVTVEEALQCTLEACAATGIFVVVKGHPINRESMQPLKRIAHPFVQRGKARYVDDASVHQLIRGASAVITVNSGAGFESLLHEKPVYTFGRSEYQCATWPVTPKSIFGVSFEEGFRPEEAKMILDAFVHHYAVDSAGFGDVASRRLAKLIQLSKA